LEKILTALARDQARLVIFLDMPGNQALSAGFSPTCFSIWYNPDQDAVSFDILPETFAADNRNPYL
jgi:hypothetical protein